jgi:hypothetical protein
MPEHPRGHQNQFHHLQKLDQYLADPTPIHFLQQFHHHLTHLFLRYEIYVEVHLC